jgi:hypothetical protein
MGIADILQNDQNTLLVIRSGDLAEYSEYLIHKASQQQEKPTDDHPISQTEAVKQWGKTRQTFVNWRKKGLITAYTVNGRIFYKPSELIAALKKVQ